MRNLTGAVCLLLWLAIASPAADFTSLQPEGYINDFAKVIDPATRATLEQYCARVKEQTGAQIAVITIESLEGEPLEDVASDIFRKWGIGEKGKDEGLLLLLVTRDRRMRLEVGYGLEPILPDGTAGSVLRAMRPALQASNYGDAVAEALNVLGTKIAQAKGVSITAPLPQRPQRRAPRSPFPGIIFAAIALLWILGAIGGRGGGRRSGGSGTGLLAGMLLGNMLGRGLGGGGGGGGFGGFSSGGGFGGFGGGSSGGGGASSSW